MSQNKSRYCIFCGRHGVKLTKEHIVSEWIAKQIHSDRPSSFRYEATRTLEGGNIETKTSNYGMRLIDFRSRSVCEECNSGWMSNIELAAQPFIQPLIHGESLHLTLQNQAILASWVTMKMMVIDHALFKTKRPHGSFFDLAKSRNFYKDAARKPPLSVVLFAARYRRTYASWLGVADFAWKHSSDQSVRATAQILVAGQFAVVALGHRITSNIMGQNPFGFDVRHLKTTAYPIYPPIQGFYWPTASFLNDEGLQDALHHWRLNPPKTSSRDDLLDSLVSQ